MQSILLISALPVLQILLGIFWLWVCGWLIRDGRENYNSVWTGSDTWTTGTLLFIWSVTCYLIYSAITWWSIILTKSYLSSL